MEENSGNMHFFGPVQCKKVSHSTQKFLHLANNENYNDATCSSERLYKLKLKPEHLNANLGEYIRHSVMRQ